MDSGHADVTVRQFLNSLFRAPQGHIDLVEAERSGDKLFFRDINLSNWRDSASPGVLYYCISSCAGESARSRRPSRKRPVQTHVIVLDDVGTKVAIDKLPAGLRPTYALETSQGNFQVGLRLTTPIEPERAAALIAALAAAGFSDPGAQSAVRIMRVPHSLNGKKENGDWRARLTTWNPDISYTLSELALAFGVTPSDVSPRSSVPELPDGESDPVAEWAVAHQGALGGAAGPPIRGLIPLRCPQEDQHTVGLERSNDSSTVWIPGAPGAFKCTHGHCEQFRTADYLAWLATIYPDAPTQDLRIDLKGLGAVIRAAAGTTAPGGGLFRPDPAAAVREAVLGDLVKVGSRDRYFTISGQEYLTRAGVDDHWFERMNAVGLLDALTPAGKSTVIAPHIWLRRQPDTRHAAKVIHRLGQPLLVDGDLNIAPVVPERPAAAGEPGPWLDLLEHLCAGNGVLMDHVIDWFAMVVGCWDEKPGWHLIMRGGQGAGKNLVSEPIREWLGEHHKRVDVSMIGGQFQPFLTKKLVTVDELKMTTRGSTTLHDVYNTLKAWTTRGNITVTINDKWLNHYTALDLSAWLLTSNEAIPMPLDEDDRRFLVIEPPPKRDIAFYERIVEWGGTGGWQQTVAWLGRQWDDMEDVSRETLRGRAPMTEAKKRLIDGSAEGIPGAVRLATSGRYGVVLPELMTAQDMLDQLQLGPVSNLLPPAYQKQLSLQRVMLAMRGAGWVQLFGGKQVEHAGTKLRLWCRSAQRAELYHQMGAGKRLVETYRKVKATPLQMRGAEIVRPSFGQDPPGQNEEPSD